MKNYKTIIAAVAAGLACTAMTSSAALSAITPGGAGANPPSNGSLAGGVQVGSTLTSNFSFGGGADQGSIQSSVWSGVTANTLGGLTFEYIITVTKGDISAIGINSFPDLNILVGSLTGTLSPSTEADLTQSGTLNFHWVPALLPGTSPSAFIVGTSDTAAAVGLATLIDGVPADLTQAVYVPVPEPTTVVAGALMLLPFGIGAIRSLRKDRTA